MGKVLNAPTGLNEEDVSSSRLMDIKINWRFNSVFEINSIQLLP